MFIYFDMKRIFCLKHFFVQRIVMISIAYIKIFPLIISLVTFPTVNNLNKISFSFNVLFYLSNINVVYSKITTIYLFQ